MLLKWFIYISEATIMLKVLVDYASDFFFSFVQIIYLDVLMIHFVKQREKRRPLLLNKVIWIRYLSCTGSRGAAGSCKRTEKPGLQPEEDTFTSSSLQKPAPVSWGRTNPAEDVVRVLFQRPRLVVPSLTTHMYHLGLIMANAWLPKASYLLALTAAKRDICGSHFANNAHH